MKELIVRVGWSLGSGEGNCSGWVELGSGGGNCSGWVELGSEGVNYSGWVEFREWRR